MSDKIIVILSGGLDSTTLVYDYKAAGFDIDCVSFDYGQRHVTEPSYAARTCEKLDLRHDIVAMNSITRLLAESGSSLISDTPVPEGHYAEENMKATVVPNRNMIMQSIALGIAVARNANFIATAVHAGDHAIYPDFRPEFYVPFNYAAWRANEGFATLDEPNYLKHSGPVRTPYIEQTKADIATNAFLLGVPLEDTWSCYQGGSKHCGRCGTCVERLEAIQDAQNRLWEGGAGKDYQDNTEYEDNEYWKEALGHV